MPANQGQNMEWLRQRLRWSEDQVHYLQVTPEGTDPFIAKGKDFSVEVGWTKFKAYSPSSDDRGGSDPYYSILQSTAAASARKLYQTLKADPSALAGIAFGKFDEWLKSQKINYEYQHSVWH